ncbi:MAG: hypothetical protein ACTSSH_03610 [Candidatus Heimdallarchaeota archaeon]
MTTEKSKPEKEIEDISDQQSEDESSNQMNERCSWCNIEHSEESALFESTIIRRSQETQQSFWTCSVEHETKTKLYFNFADRFYFLYLLFVLLIPIVLAFLSFFYWSLVFTFGIFMSLGLGLVILPLVGNQLAMNLGLRRANIIGRVLGAMLIAIGLTLLFTNGLQIFRPS